MNLFFFETNITAALREVNSMQHACALWYTKGLTAYNHLPHFMQIDSVSIEPGLAEDFRKDNPDLAAGFQLKMTDHGPGESSAITKKPQETSVITTNPICFFASNDTIARSFKPVIDQLQKLNVDHVLYCRENEGAHQAAEKMGLKATVVKRIAKPQRYGCLVLGNDWGLKEWRINNDFLDQGINTVCLQESSIDFNPVDRRMKQCSFPIFQGSASLENIDITGRIGAVIGNPRFEDLLPAPLPQKQKILANVNFTYGVFENAREQWVKDVVGSCKKLSLDYVLSQHPRDGGDLSEYNSIKSNPLLVHDGIREASVVVSRFSALLTEAICLGRPAIYYNPHGENMHYKFKTDNAMLYYAENESELMDALQKVSENFNSAAAAKSSFLEDHLGVTNNRTASEIIARCLMNVASFPSVKKKATVLQTGKLYGRIAKRILDGKPY